MAKAVFTPSLCTFWTRAARLPQRSVVRSAPAGVLLRTSANTSHPNAKIVSGRCLFIAPAPTIEVVLLLGEVQPGAVGRTLLHAGPRVVADALGEDRLQARLLLRREGHRVVLEPNRLQPALEDVPAERSARGDAHRRIDGKQPVAHGGRVERERLLVVDPCGVPAGILERRRLVTVGLDGGEG